MPIKKRLKRPVKNATMRGGDERTFDIAVQKTSVPTIDCSKIDLGKLMEAVLANDADEVLVRISQFDHNLEPANFQAIVRFSDRTRPWAVCVNSDMTTALVTALREGASVDNPNSIRGNNESATKLQRDVESGRPGNPRRLGAKTRRPLRKP